MHIPKIDNYEASVPTRVRDLRVGDRIATGWSTHDTVIGIEPTPSGAYLTLRPQRAATYRVHRKTPVPVIR